MRRGMTGNPTLDPEAPRVPSIVRGQLPKVALESTDTLPRGRLRRDGSTILRKTFPLTVVYCFLQHNICISMHSSLRMRQYQHQAVMTCSPEQLILKLYEAGITACIRDDRPRLRAVLVELITALNFEDGGDIAQRLHAIYESCLIQSSEPDVSPVQDVLTGLRDAWRETVLPLKAA